MTKGTPRKKMANRYEVAEYDRQVKQRRIEFVFSEMLRDPSSRFHGMSYALRPGCPCNCAKCEARRLRRIKEARERRNRCR